MTEVGIREMKNRLSEFVRRAARGETILVTDRGRVVAQLTRPGIGAQQGLDLLAALEEDGLLTQRGRDNEAALYESPEPRLERGTSAALLDAVREDS